jgi:hypothetical protein
MAGPVRISVVANAAKARAELNATADSATAMGAKFSRVGSVMKTALAGGAIAAGVAVGAFAVKAVKDASDLNETVNKTDIIFGKNAATIKKWADGAATSTGLSKGAALEAASGFGDMFSQIGFTQQAATKMSTSVVGLAADFGSFNNLPTEDVTQRISAAFRGEYDSLQALVPNINAARVEQEALAATHKKSTKELTSAEKATAVLAILNKDGARAVGDFAKTSEGAANKQKILAARMENISATIGQLLLPVMDGLLVAGEAVTAWITSTAVPAFQRWAPVVAQVAQQGFGVLRSALPAVSTALSGLFTVLSNPAFQAFAASVGAVVVSMQIYSGVMATVRAATAAWAAIQAVLNVVLAANPVGLIVLGIVALAAGLVVAYQRSETFRNVVNAAFAVVKTVVLTTWSAISEAATQAWSVVQTVVSVVVSAVTAYVNAYRLVATTAWRLISSAASAAWGAIRAVVGAAASVVVGHVNLVRSTALRVWRAISTAASTAFNAVASVASSVTSRVTGFFSGALSTILSLFGPSTLYNAGARLIQGLANGIGDRIGAVVDKVREGLSVIKGMLPGSPIKSGPLLPWNGGKPGKLLMGMLASGIVAGAPSVSDALSGSISARVELNAAGGASSDSDTLDQILSILSNQASQQAAQHEQELAAQLDVARAVAASGSSITSALKTAARDTARYVP